MLLIYYFLTFIIRIYMKLFYPYKIINKDRFKNIKGCIIAANHISANDPPFIGSVIPKRISILAKSELFRNPIFGRFLRSMGAISIKRGKVDRKAISEVESRLKKGQATIIFPEGTRKSDKVKAGIGKIALESGADILPVYIKNSDRFKDCFLRKKKMYIVIGELIRIADFEEGGLEKENYQRIADHTMKKIRELENECKDS